MKVCDKHNDQRAVDTFHMAKDDVFMDVCDECKYAVMNFLNGVTKEIESKDKKSLAQKLFGK